MKIKNLFDASKDIYRTIEKVITYSASQEERLKGEIKEYIVTESIEEHFEELLDKMQAAMETGEETEVGVWVSGFYGSGKSSFTKYLGLALDENIKVDGTRFLEHLQDRMSKPQTKALLSTVSKKFPASVVMLDLASEMVAGATMEEVSTVLYYKVLQWAEYSRNLKVAALERKVQKDSRFDEFESIINDELGVPWKDVQNDPLVIDSLLPDIAHRMYPELFKTATSFSTDTTEIIQFEKDRVEEMLEIVRDVSGKDYILFIIDEVGQYVGSRPNLILNLDGLAKNLKGIGQGKVWIFATAQQTLTEDDPRAALNSPELFKLGARFPIQLDLEAKDIKEISYRRLLGKSPEGEKILGELFDKHGQALRHNTKLQDAAYYDSDFDKTSFTNLYPFLPAHFDILLHLLGNLAKSTGGIGLRSAIKIIQDILIEEQDNKAPVVDQQLGWIATTVTLYDALEKDIRRAFLSVHKSVSKALIRYPDSEIHKDVAKTVAVLQILGNMPVTSQNVTSLMHQSVESPSKKDEVEKAIEDLKNDPIVPFGDKEGSLCFYSEKLNDIEQERGQIPVRSIEAKRIKNEALTEVFSPLPSTKLHDSLTIKSGLKAMTGAMVSSLAGNKETIQSVVEFVPPTEYESARTRLVEESRQRTSQNSIYIIGRTLEEADGLVSEIFRCKEIANRYRNDPDKEVKEYCASQSDRAIRLGSDLQRLLNRSLGQGSFIFRGQTTATENLDLDANEAAKKLLADVAGEVFDRYTEASVRADTSLAEKFLRTGNLKAITSNIDPLDLVQIKSGKPQINTDHKSILSIKDYIDRFGTVDGKRLIDHFSDAPFGWSQDTLRYIIATMLIAGEVKLKVSGREITVNGQQAIDALRTNNAFKNVGVSLRDERPSVDVLARAAERLTELIGEDIIPLEDEISKAATKHFPRFQNQFGGLPERLDGLGLPGGELVRSVMQEIEDILLTDASDAPQGLGGEESILFEGLSWAVKVDKALKSGVDVTVHDLQRHRTEINNLPGSGIPGKLQVELEEELVLLGERLAQESFYEHATDLNTILTGIKSTVRDVRIEMKEAQKESIKEAQMDLQRLPEWNELTQEEQSEQRAQLEALEIDPEADISGLKTLINQEYVIQNRVSNLKVEIQRLGHDRQLERLREEQEKAKSEGKKKITRTVKIPAKVTEVAQLEALVQELNAIKSELAIYGEIEVIIEIED